MNLISRKLPGPHDNVLYILIKFMDSSQKLSLGNEELIKFDL